MKKCGFEALILSSLFACNTSDSASKQGANPAQEYYRPDTSAVTISLRNELDSMEWQRFLFEELHFALIAPAAWKKCPIPPEAILCISDSVKRNGFTPNLLISLFPGTSLTDLDEKNLKDVAFNTKWTLVEDNPYNKFWTVNEMKAYTTTDKFEGRSYDLGLWCFSFETDEGAIEVTLVGLLDDVEYLDYLFKFIASRIERV